MSSTVTISIGISLEVDTGMVASIMSKGEYVGAAVGKNDESSSIVPSEDTELGPIDIVCGDAVGGEFIGSDVIICVDVEGVGSNVNSMVGKALGSDGVTSSASGSGSGIVTSSTGGSVDAR